MASPKREWLNRLPGPYTPTDVPSMTMRTDSEPRTNSQALVSDEEVKALILSAQPQGSGDGCKGTLKVFWELGVGFWEFHSR